MSTFDRVDELLEDALRIGPVNEEPPRPTQQIITNNALNRTAKLNGAEIGELVFILDGWDEVSLTGSASYQAQLEKWLPRIREFFVDRPGHPVRVVMTGRPSAHVRSSGILKSPTQILTLRHMSPAALRGFANAIAERVNHPSAPLQSSWRLDVSNLEAVFERYERWFSSASEGGKKIGGMDVIGTPLLAFLTFRTLADWKGDPAKLIDEPTALYQALIDITVEHAGKGRDERVEGSVHRGGGRLRHLLHKVASIITILGREAVSFTELDYRLEDDESFKDWYSSAGLCGAVSEATRKSALHELVVNFYFKGGNTGIGCEFLHKSFREYLFAEAIVAVLKNLSAGKSGTLECPQIIRGQDFLSGTPQYEASRELSQLLAPQRLSDEVRGHLFWLLDKEMRADPNQWVWVRDVLLDVYIWWAEAVHLRPQPRRGRGARQWCPSYVNELLEYALPFDPDDPVEATPITILDANLGYALMLLSVEVYAALADQPRTKDPDGSFRTLYRRTSNKVRFAPGGRGNFRTLCSRINANSNYFPVSARLPGIDLTNNDCAAIVFFRAFLKDSRFENAKIFAAQLNYAQLEGADLRGADLWDTNMTRANLMESNLTKADLTTANLTTADLTKANLTAANLTEANLTEANLTEADLTKADLTRADLTKANLTKANLTGANLRGANLTEANLTKADLTGADLTDAQLAHAILGGAKVTSRQLKKAFRD